jgi:hypothetical protein
MASLAVECYRDRHQPELVAVLLSVEKCLLGQLTYGYVCTFRRGSRA